MAQSLPNLRSRSRRGSSNSAQQEFSHSQAALRYEERARQEADVAGRARSAGTSQPAGARPMVYKSPYEEIQYDSLPKKRTGHGAALLGPGGRGETVPAFAHIS